MVVQHDANNDSPPDHSTLDSGLLASMLRLATLPAAWDAGLTEHILRRRLSKSQSIRLSNWEQVPLTSRQRDYAAADALASLLLYETLHKMPVTRQPQQQLGVPLRTEAGSKGGVGGGAADAGPLISACPVPRRLQPAKLEACAAHFLRSATAGEVAGERGIKEGTVQVRGGEAPLWQQLKMPVPAVHTHAQRLCLQMCMCQCRGGCQHQGMQQARLITVAHATSSPHHSRPCCSATWPRG
jgi:hypothetical protein